MFVLTQPANLSYESHPQSAATTLGLHQLPAGEQAWVCHLVEDEAARPVLLRLLEIGFLPGEPVRVIARGFPAGDPLAVRVGHSTFALRRHEAALVCVSTDARLAEVSA